MTPPDYLLFIAQAGAGALYALILERVFQRKYEPGYTWVTVVWGTAQTGVLVAVRLLVAPVPAMTPEHAAWWCWWLWALSFAASGAPIIIWQVVLQDRRWKRVLDAYERWSRHD